ncbi:barstar family protein [Lysobacter cavernae]|uniref:Barstar family protein n=1 Tax=Lysobacter cavernae TaxID=1685901 RepID=A0ABV7RST5_9GAMM
MNATDLRSVLADAEHSGAYFVADTDTEAMAQAGAALGYAVLRIDLAGCTDKTELMRRFATAGQFPGWFGGNWDALADVLGDLSWLRGDGYLVLVEHASDWRAAHGEDFDTLLDLLNEAAFRWAEQDTAFWALLPFPAEQLAALDD